jgi:transcriptional regulator with XRE-family HTH domain
MLTDDPVLAALGQNVRKARETKQLTQEKLAEFASLDPTYISGIERGLRNPGIKNVAKIAKALGITTSDLCKGVESNNKPTAEKKTAHKTPQKASARRINK